MSSDSPALDMAGIDAGGGRDAGWEKFDEARCASGKLRLNHVRLRPRSVHPDRRRVDALPYFPHDVWTSTICAIYNDAHNDNRNSADEMAR